MSDLMWKVARLVCVAMMVFLLANIPTAQPLFIGQVGKFALLHLSILYSGNAVVETGSTFIKPGEKITWLCKPIHVVVNVRYAPPGAVNDVKQALIILSKATGVSWKHIGETSLVPSTNHLIHAPVLVSWQRNRSLHELGESTVDPSVAGKAGPYYSRDRSHWSSGFVTLNADNDYRYLPGFGKGRTRGALILHELGHVAGLGHVRDSNEIMAEFSSHLNRPANFGPGDLAGLRAQFPGCRSKS